MAACRLGYLVADPDVVAACEAVALPYHLDAVDPGRRRAGPALRRRDGGPRGRRGRRARQDRRRLWRTCRWRRGRRTPTSSCSAHWAEAAARCGGTSLERSVLVRDCSSWAGLAGCLRVTVGTPAENDRFLAALGRSLGATDERTQPMTSDGSRRAARRAHHQGDRDRGLGRPSTGPGAVEVSTGLPFFDHMLDAARPPRRVRPRWCGPRATWHVDAHHTVEDVGIVLGEAVAEALGDKAGVRRFASVAAAPRRGPGRGGPRPLGPALPRLRRPASPPTRPGSAHRPSTPQLAEEFWRAFVTAAGITLHVRLGDGQEHPPHRRGHRSRRWPAPCATRCGSRAAASPRPRAPCEPAVAGDAGTDRRPRLRHRQPALGREGPRAPRGADARLVADPDEVGRGGRGGAARGGRLRRLRRGPAQRTGLGEAARRAVELGRPVPRHLRRLPAPLRTESEESPGIGRARRAGRDGPAARPAG